MIDVHELSKRYGDKLALDRVSFHIARGEVVGLLGLNGAGKSTTMNILTGYIGATSGTVAVAGHDVAREPREAKRLIGYLPEQLAFYAEMRVREYLDFCCDLKGVRTNRAAHLAEIAARVGIAPVTHRLIRNLSRGYRQRLGLAQALIGDPPVLILDEPTAGLDPSQVVEIRALIHELGQTRTVLVSSHVLSEIQAICSRVIVLHHGRVLADDTPANLSHALQPVHRVVARIQGAPEQVQAALAPLAALEQVTLLAQAEPGTCDVLIESAAGRDIRADVFRALARADLPLLSTQAHEASLEDVFLHLVADEPTEGQPAAASQPHGRA